MAYNEGVPLSAPCKSANSRQTSKHVIAIGASTGGTEAIVKVMRTIIINPLYHTCRWCINMGNRRCYTCHLRSWLRNSLITNELLVDIWALFCYYLQKSEPWTELTASNSANEWISYRLWNQHLITMFMRAPTFVTRLDIAKFPLRAYRCDFVTWRSQSGADKEFLKAGVTLTDRLRSDLYRSLRTALRVRNYVIKSPDMWLSYSD
jgi:hypothetical protein